MKSKIAKLIDLKTIISLIVVVSYTIMVFCKIVEPDYKDVLIMVITYYFAKPQGSDENDLQ